MRTVLAFVGMVLAITLVLAIVILAWVEYVDVYLKPFS